VTPSTPGKKPHKVHEKANKWKIAAQKVADKAKADAEKEKAKLH